jgi:phospholipid N-methyltransferase
MTPPTDTVTEDAPFAYHGRFLKAFFRNSAHVGAIAPSSSELSANLADTVDWDNVDCVIEYGPGTGVVTQEVARRLKGKTRFFAIEREPEFAEITRRRCPDIEVIEGCVTNVQEYCRERGIAKVDAILSGLPWASFPVSLTEEILDATFEVLPVGGKFATFAYWQGLLLPGSRRFRSLLKEHFSEVERTRTAWRNLPPAFVYRCER